MAATVRTIKPRAALYARVSTVRQAERDLSIPDQIRQMQEFCIQKDYEIIDKYIEPGASATNDARPEFQKMMFAATSDKQPYDVILVHSYSRFARNLRESEVWIHELMSRGVRVVAITQPIDDSPEGSMMRGLFELFDQYQSEQNSKHTKRAMCQCARDGYWPGSVAPDGYRKVAAATVGDKIRYKVEPDPERAAVIQNIFDMAFRGTGNGPMGVKAIVVWLNTHGFRTRKGKRWGIATVHRLLTCTTYIGELYFNRTSSKFEGERPRDEWILHSVEPIISREVFDEVGRSLKARAPGKTPPRLPTSPLLLTGLTFCGHCGSAMTQMTGKGGKYSYYACAAKKRTGADCTARNISQADLEKLVCELLIERVLDPSRIDALISECVAAMQVTSNPEAQLRAAQKTLSQAETGLKRLYDGVAAGVLNPSEPMFKEQIDGLTLRQMNAQVELSRCKTLQKAALKKPTSTQIDRFVEDLRCRLTEGNVPLRKAYIRAFVDRITVTGGEVRVQGRKNVLATAAASGRIEPTGVVPTFVPEWRARQESNL